MSELIALRAKVIKQEETIKQLEQLTQALLQSQKTQEAQEAQETQEAQEAQGISADVLLDNLIQNLPGHLYWKDTKGNYLGCNREQALYLGFSSCDEIVGLSDFDLAWKDQATLLCHIDQSVIRSGRTYSAEEPVEKDGQKSVFLSKKTPLIDNDGEIIGVVGVSVDITELSDALSALRIAKQEAESSNLAKSEFIANISHDIRTPFCGIVTLTEDLLLSEKQEERKAKLKTVLDSSHSLLGLLNRVLEVAEMQSVHAPSPPVYFNLEKKLQEVCATAQMMAHQKDLVVECCVDAALGEPLFHHENELQRIVHNLVNNAVRYTGSGQVTVTAEAQAGVLGQPGLLITVADSGVGIPEERLSDIFEKFSKLGQSFTGKNSGYGLGLWIVKRLVENIQATIQVTSEVGEGSTFAVWIPLLATNSEQVVYEKPAPITGSRVLLIEDNPIAKAAAEVILGDMQYEVTVAETATEAIAALDNEFDIILLDLGLPDLSGIELAERIIEHNAGRAMIVAVTAHASYAEQRILKQLGVAAVLEKPFRKLQLEEVASRHKQ